MNLPFRDDIHLLAGAYALDALDDLERQRFEQHLATCASCQDDVAGFAEATASLATATSEMPPEGLRHRVLEQIDQTRQVSGGHRRSRRSRTIARWSAAATAAAAIAALSIVNLQQRHTNEHLSAQADLLRAPDLRISTLKGGDGTVRVVYSPSRSAAVLMADGLVDPPSDRTYELWIIRDGNPEAEVLFRTGSDARATATLPIAPTSGSVFAVTQEPRGGSKSPTTQPTHVSDPL